MTRTLLLSALLLAMPFGGARASAPAAQDPSAQAQWTRFLAQGRYERINTAYAALGAVHYSYDSVVAAACREKRATLDEAVRDVPVGLALRHAAMLCAEAREDAADAAAQAEALGALVRLATQQAGSAPWELPIRVVRPEDVDVYLRLAGLERRYAYFGGIWPAEDGLPLHVAAVDEASPRERHIAFDWVDTLARLASDDRYQGYLIDRHLIVNAFLDSWAQDDDTASVDLLGLRQALLEDTAAGRRDRLKAAAGRGGVLAAQAWLELCTRQPFAGCGDGLVDALLPLAEEGHAISRAQLGLAYLRGIGVAADAKAARAMVEAAESAWANHGALLYLGTVLSLADAAPPAWLASRMADAEAKGGATLRAFRLASAVDGPSPALAQGDREWLARPANNRRGRGFALLAKVAEAAKSADAAQWRERAAAAGDPESMRMRALEVLATSPADPPARQRLREAALLGDDVAVRRMAYDAAVAGRAREAHAWVMGKVAEGDVDSLMLLAGLYEDGLDDPKMGPKDAVELYRDLVDEVPAARRRLAVLLAEGRGAPKDTAEARRLLERVPDDVESQSLLGGMLLNGRIPGDAAAGRALLEKAIAGGSRDAMSGYGLWLANHESSADGRRRGLELIRKAADAGDPTARNNLAWVHCVSRHADVVDAAKGVEAARGLGSVDALPSGLIDTVAACEVAAGRFDEGVRLQSLALERLPKGAAFAATREGMSARLALYRKRQRYVEPAAAAD